MYNLNFIVAKFILPSFPDFCSLSQTEMTETTADILFRGMSYSCSRKTSPAKGLCKVNKFQKSQLTMKVGEWLQVSLRKKFGKSQNSPTPILIFYGSIPCVYIHCQKVLVVMI